MHLIQDRMSVLLFAAQVLLAERMDYKIYNTENVHYIYNVKTIACKPDFKKFYLMTFSVYIYKTITLMLKHFNILFNKYIPHTTLVAEIIL